MELGRRLPDNISGQVMEEIHRGDQAGDQEDGAASEDDDEMSHNEPLPSEDAGGTVHNITTITHTLSQNNKAKQYQGR